MRRDIVAGCIGLAITAYWVYSRPRPVIVKPIEYSPFLHKPEFVFTDMSGLRLRKSPPPPPPRTYVVPDNVENATRLDDFLQLPLETDGSINDSSEKVMLDANMLFTKYVRFQCGKIRNSKTVKLGGFRFLFEANQIPFDYIKIWNPHTGETSDYKGEPWSDSDQCTIIFCFKEALQIDAYEIKTSSMSTDFDPIRWTIDGSLNGSFWRVIDSRNFEDAMFPLERGRIMKFKIEPQMFSDEINYN